MTSLIIFLGWRGIIRKICQNFYATLNLFLYREVKLKSRKDFVRQFKLTFEHQNILDLRGQNEFLRLYVNVPHKSSLIYFHSQ